MESMWDVERWGIHVPDSLLVPGPLHLLPESLVSQLVALNSQPPHDFSPNWPVPARGLDLILHSVYKSV
jgi:hypothetical protein